jgi:hypothetical protein
MGQNLLNYTTEIPVEKTIGQIQQVLVKAHATSILTEYDNGAIKAIMFKIRGKNGPDAVMSASGTWRVGWCPG